MSCHTCGNEAVYSITFKDKSNKLSCADHLSSYRSNRLYANSQLMIPNSKKLLISSELSSNLTLIEGMIGMYLKISDRINSSLVFNDFIDQLSRCRLFLTRQLVAVLQCNEVELSNEMVANITSSDEQLQQEVQKWVYPDIWIDLDSESQVSATQLDAVKKSFYEKVMIDFFIGGNSGSSIFASISYYDEREDNCLKTYDVRNGGSVIVRLIRFGRTIFTPCTVNLPKMNLMLVIGGFRNGDQPMNSCFLVNTELASVISMFYFPISVIINYSTVGIYHNMNIYLIGPKGANSSNTEIWSLSLLTQEFKKLINIPESLEQISAILIKDNIYFTGFGAFKVYKYSILNNEVSTILELNKNTEDIASLLTFGKRVFLVYGGQMLETDEKFTSIRVVKEDVPEEFNAVEYVEVENGIIFRDYSCLNFLDIRNFSCVNISEEEIQ